MNRRNFIKGASAAGMLTGSSAITAGNRPSVLSAKPLRILFLGGTNYIGPVIVRRLLEAGHIVTLFNRGKTNPQLFPELEKLRGNRYPHIGTGLSSLDSDRQWDVIIDTWQESPLCTRDSAQLLGKRCLLYLYVSTIAVYGRQNFMHSTHLQENAVIPSEKLTQDYQQPLGYEQRKRAAEQLLTQNLPHNLTILRPHSICGFALDSLSDNQRYWPIRLQRGGDILCPGDGHDQTQYIDVNDLAEFTLTSIEGGLRGIYNVCTNEKMLAYLYGLKALSQVPADLHFVDYQYLKQQSVKRFSDMPMWVPRQEVPGFFSVSNTKALHAGLTISSLEKTFKEVIAGFYARESADYKFGEGASSAGLTAERERDVLVKWQKRKS